MIFIYIYIYINSKVFISSSIGEIRIKNFKIILFDVDVFMRKLGLIFKFDQLIGYLVRNISMEKLYRKHALKTSPIPFFEASVHLFIINFYFSLNDRLSKTMEDVFYFI